MIPFLSGADSELWKILKAYYSSFQLLPCPIFSLSLSNPPHSNNLNLEDSGAGVHKLTHDFVDASAGTRLLISTFLPPCQKINSFVS